MEKEHLWPDWLHNIYPDIEIAIHQTGGTIAQEKHRVARPFETRWQIVDHACNHGWMGGLENRARRCLAPLVLGQRRTVKRYDQRVIALWVAKTAMTLLYADPDWRADVIPRSHYRHVWQFQQPPRHSVISLAPITLEAPAWAGAQLCNYFATRIRRIPSQDGKGYVVVSDDYRLYGITMSVGNLAMQFFGGDLFDAQADIAYGGPLGQAMVRLHPIGSGPLNWPTSIALDGSTLREAHFLLTGTRPP